MKSGLTEVGPDFSSGSSYYVARRISFLNENAWDRVCGPIPGG